MGGDHPLPKTYKNNFFVQFGNQHLWYKAIAAHCFVTVVLWSMLHLSYSSEAIMRLDYIILLFAVTVGLLQSSQALVTNEFYP